MRNLKNLLGYGVLLAVLLGGMHACTMFAVAALAAEEQSRLERTQEVRAIAKARGLYDENTR